MREALRKAINTQADKVGAIAAACTQETRGKLLGLIGTLVPASIYFLSVGALPISPDAENHTYIKLSWAGNITKIQEQILLTLAKKLRDMALEDLNGADVELADTSILGSVDQIVITKANNAINDAILSLLTLSGNHYQDNFQISTRFPIIDALNAVRKQINLQANAASELTPATEGFAGAFMGQVIECLPKRSPDAEEIMQNLNKVCREFEELLSTLPKDRAVPSPSAPGSPAPA